MCGIAAIFAYSPDAPGVERGELIAIRDQMIKRGPDGSGEYFSPDGRVALGHRRLSIIDLSEAGAQPMWNAEKTLGVTFNGEIYNYRELRAELEAQGCRFRSHSDTEVLLHLYQTDGADMVRRLRGMFAFAIWDAPRRTLFLARDPFGIKPLYYADDGRTLRAASQVKALLAGGKIDTAPEPAGHVGFFLWGHVPDPFTLYCGIRALPAGHTLTISESENQKAESRNPVLRCYCSIPEMLGSIGNLPVMAGNLPGDSASSFQLSTFNSQLLRESLRDSVAHHLLADVPVGVFLSSGLDSTTLAALAAEQGGALRTVTLGFEEYRGTPNDETPLAELVARQYGAQHQTCWVSRQDFATETDSLFAAMDQPSTDGVNTYFVSQVTRAAGLKVALSGLGGDELFGGYPSFRDIPRLVSALRPFQWLLGGTGATLSALGRGAGGEVFGDSPGNFLGRGFRIVSGPFLQRFTSPKYAGLLEYGGTFGGAYLLRRGMFMPWELPEILDPDLVRAGWATLNTLPALNATASLLRSGEKVSEGRMRCDSDATADLSPISAFRFPLSAFPDRLRVSALELSWYMRNQLLRDSDWAGMAHSLEIRTPLVDTTLLRSLLPALGSATPPTKLDMACTPTHRLPSTVLNRPKTGFTIPVRDWLLASASSSNGRVVPRSRSPVVSSQNRGLRGWAHEVYSRFTGPVVPSSRGHMVGYTAPSTVAPSSDLPSSALRPRSSVVSPAIVPKRILVFRIGQLGDTIVALPSMWAIRKQFPDTQITLLSDSHPKSGYVHATDLLDGAGIFDEYIGYPVRKGLRQTIEGWRLIRELRKRRFDTLVYLAPSNRSSRQIARDRWFFKKTGIQTFMGMDKFPQLPAKRPGVPLPNSEREAVLLLKRVSGSGVVTALDNHDFELHLSSREQDLVQDWLSHQAQSDGGRPWIAIGPGSKMPAKQWPVERYEQVVHHLIKAFDVWPVVFGGPEDSQMAGTLLRNWNRGYSAAGALNVRSAALALKRCVFYLGNDTGTMHLAASVGIPCIPIFSSRERPGMWYPHGDKNRVFRSEIDCEGCGLTICPERKNECLRMIVSESVAIACDEILTLAMDKAKAQQENADGVMH